MDLKTVFIDSPSTNFEMYELAIRKNLKNQKVKLILEHKAEDKYLMVAAASIIAKFLREKEITKIKSEIKIDFGSGYTSDPITQKFINKYWDTHSNIFRQEWKTYKKVVKSKNQTTLHYNT